MRIFHGIHNIGGMAGLLARAQRELGHEAVSFCHPTGSFQFPSDRTIRGTDLLARAAEIGRFLLFEARRFDCFHFYFGSSLLGASLGDVAWLAELGKKVFFYFCGCDIRDSKKVIEKYEISACRECWPMLCSPNQTRARQAATEHAGAVFVSTPDLLEFVPRSRLLPQPIDLPAFEERARNARARTINGRPLIDRPVRIAHAPTNRSIKGTRHIEASVERLTAEGLPLELILIERMSHDEALAISASCDLAIDQVLIGAYGQYAVETMALGKPTICYIRDDLAQCYPRPCPAISAPPSDLDRVIADWVTHPEWWEDRSREGIEYVRVVHDHHAIARRCVEVYEECGAR
jgi:hypothetical protein